MRQVCYGIVGKTKMYFSDSCICQDKEPLITEELPGAREEEPEEDYKVVPLYTKRR